MASPANYVLAASMATVCRADPTTLREAAFLSSVLCTKLEQREMADSGTNNSLPAKRPRANDDDKQRTQCVLSCTQWPVEHLLYDSTALNGR